MAGRPDDRHEDTAGSRQRSDARDPGCRSRADARGSQDSTRDARDAPRATAPDDAEGNECARQARRRRDEGVRRPLWRPGAVHDGHVPRNVATRKRAWWDRVGQRAKVKGQRSGERYKVIGTRYKVHVVAGLALMAAVAAS